MKKMLEHGPLQRCYLCYTHGITGDRPQERADSSTERGVETTSFFKTGAGFATDNRNNKKQIPVDVTPYPPYLLPLRLIGL